MHHPHGPARGRRLAGALAALGLVAAQACTLPPFMAREAGALDASDGALTEGGVPDALDEDAASPDASDALLAPEVLTPDAGDGGPPPDAGDATPPDASDGGPLPDGAVAPGLRLLWVSITSLDIAEISAGGASLRDLRLETGARTCSGEQCASVGVRP